MDNHLVSVVIPIYKTEKYIAGCLDSVVNQTYTNLEIIAVDDGSPDESNKIVESYLDREGRLRLIKQKNQGLSGARNTGIKEANGHYLLFLDSDDTLALDAIEGMVKKANKTNADLVIPDRYTKHIESSGKRSVEFHFSEKEKIDNPLRFALEVVIAKGRAWRAHSLLYKSQTIQENEILFPVGYTQEDIVFNLQVLSFAKKISFYNKSTVFYLKRDNSITTSYNDKLMDIFLFIDSKVENFLDNNNVNNEKGQTYKDVLLCRNVVIVLTYLWSSSNKVSFKVKLNKANDILKKERIVQAFRRKSKVSPYFNSINAIFYFKLMFTLIEWRMTLLSYLFAFVAGKFFVKT